MKNLRFLCILFLCLILLSAGGIRLFIKPAGGTDKPGVLTSFYPMYVTASFLLKDVDAVTLSNLSEPQTGCLHDYSLTTGDMKRLSAALALVINGGGIEPFLPDVTAAYPGLKIIDAGAGQTALPEGHHHEDESEGHEAADEPGELHHEDGDEPKGHHHEDGVGELHHEDSDEPEGHHHEAEATDESEGHHHEDGENAHYWMSVPRYEEQVLAVRDGLCSLLADDRAACSVIKNNAAAYTKSLQALCREQADLVPALSGQKVILFHEAYAYIAQDYGMDVSLVMDLDEERQVSAGEVAKVIRTIRKGDVSLILAEETYGREMGDLVSSQTDATVLYLDTIVREQPGDGPDAYIRRMHNNILLLKKYVTTRQRE